MSGEAECRAWQRWHSRYGSGATGCEAKAGAALAARGAEVKAAQPTVPVPVPACSCEEEGEVPFGAGNPCVSMSLLKDPLREPRREPLLPTLPF